MICLNFILDCLIQILRIERKSLIIGVQNLVVEERRQMGDQIPTVHNGKVVIILGVFAKQLVNVRDRSLHRGLALGVTAPNGCNDNDTAVGIFLVNHLKESARICLKCFKSAHAPVIRAVGNGHVVNVCHVIALCKLGRCNSRIPWQLEKNNVVPLSSKYEAPVSYSVSREVPCSVLKCETVLGTLDATPKFP